MKITTVKYPMKMKMNEFSWAHFRSRLYRIRTCLHDELHYSVLRHREDTIKLFYDDVAKCIPPFTTIAPGSDARNKPRSRLSLQRLTFPSASLLLRVRVPFAIVYFSHFPLSHRTPRKCQMYKCLRSKKVIGFETNDSILNRRICSRKFIKFRWITNECCLCWSGSMSTNDWRFPVCQCSYLIICLKLC